MDEPHDLAFRAPKLITAAGETAGVVVVRHGRIAALAPLDADIAATEVIELADDEVLLPGLVDTHVHVNDPGRAEWEGFATATAAAAAGGVTTVLDMPLNSLPPTVDIAALEAKRAAALGRAHIDVGLWGGAVPGNLGDLRSLHERGVFGFKCFTLHSGVDEFPPLSPGELESALTELAGFDAMLLVHAEDPDTIERAPAPHGPRYAHFVASRPPEAEHRAIERVLDLARRTGARVHVLHLSSAGALPLIAAARAEGVRVTVETCPHYLSFSAEEVPDGASRFKACPPIREAANRELLWQGLADRTIDCVVSDHSPCTADLKTADFGTAWGGISGLQVGLPAMWTQARDRGFGLADVVRWMSEGPARIAGLSRKGVLEVGADADLCVFAPDESVTVSASALRHRNPISAYDGLTLSGAVRGTWLRGRRVDGTPRGRLLMRGEA